MTHYSLTMKSYFCIRFDSISNTEKVEAKLVFLKNVKLNFVNFFRYDVFIFIHKLTGKESINKEQISCVSKAV